MSPSDKSVVGKIRAMRHPLFLGFVVVNKIAAGVVVSRNRRRRSVSTSTSTSARTSSSYSHSQLPLPSRFCCAATLLQTFVFVVAGAVRSLSGCSGYCFHYAHVTLPLLPPLPLLLLLLCQYPTTRFTRGICGYFRSEGGVMH